MTSPGRGFDSYVCCADETTWGTPVATGMICARILSEGMAADQGDRPTPGMGDGFINTLWRGNKLVGGDIPMEGNFEGAIWYFLKHCMGGYAFTIDTPVASANTHLMAANAAWPPDDTGVCEGLTVEVSKGNIPAGKMFMYEGCVVPQWAISFGVDEVARVVATVIAEDETTNVTASSALVAPGAPELKYHYAGAFSCAGVAALPVKSGTIVINRMGDRRYLMGSRLTAKPHAIDRRVITGTLVVEFHDLDEYDAIVAATDGAASITFTSTEFITGSTPYTASFVFGTTRMTAGTPVVAGPGPMEVPIAFQATTGTDLAVSVVNGQAIMGAVLP